MDEVLMQGCSCDAGGGGGDTRGGATKPTFAVVFSSLISLTGYFAYGCANGYSSPAQSGIIDDLGLSTAQYSLFGSLLTFGAMLGAILSGKLSDVLGRKGVTWFLQLFLIMGWLAIAFAKDVWWTELGRLLLGFSVGIQNYVSIIYVAEITPKDFRGAFTMASQLMVCGGITLMFLIGNIVSWRTLALIGTIPCLIQIIGLLFIPESPRWLAKVGRDEESNSALQWLRGKEADITHEVADIKNSTRSFVWRRSGFAQLQERKYARPLTVGIGIALLIPWEGVNGILFYASSIFEAAGCTTIVGTITITLIQIPFSILGVLLMDKFGRRPLFMVDITGVCLGGILAGLGFLLQEFKLLKNFTPTIVLMSMTIYFAFCALGASLPFVIISEIFPMNIKGSAGSLASFANCFSSWIVAYAFNFLFQWSPSGVFFIFASICALLILFVAKMLPETKGLSLEEIQALWSQEQH